MGDEVSTGPDNPVAEETLEQLADESFVRQLSDARLMSCAQRTMREFRWMAARSVLTVTASADYGRAVALNQMLEARVAMENAFPHLKPLERMCLDLELQAARAEVLRISTFPDHLQKRLYAIAVACGVLHNEEEVRYWVARGYDRSEFTVLTEEVSTNGVVGRITFHSIPRLRVWRRRMRLLKTW